MTADASSQSAAAGMLQLPDPCLLAVLRCCDTHGVCSAARAHSRLHQAAIVALTSVTVDARQGGNRQLRLHSLVDLYLIRRGQYIDSLSLSAGHGMTLTQLPTTLTKLTSLTAWEMDLQLLPGCGKRGVLGAPVTPPLKRLQLNRCHIENYTGEGLTAALALLPDLEHLGLASNENLNWRRGLALSGDALQKLPQLTYLEVSNVRMGLQHVTALTRLVDLRLFLPGGRGCDVTAGMLSSAQQLTHLQLQTGESFGFEPFGFEPGALAGKTLLQHLELQHCHMPGGASGVAQLLSELPKLQQLTSLVLSRSLKAPATPAAAYSALTASSKLQRLDIRECRIPAGVWQHMFPAGWQLPYLRELDILGVSGSILEGSRLVSCCPGLQSLNTRCSACGSELLGLLQGLSSLTSLSLQPAADTAEQWVQAVKGVCQLTGLRQLELWEPSSTREWLLLQLTQLQQLTHLHLRRPCSSTEAMQQQQRASGQHLDVSLHCAAPGDTPVWRQMLQHHFGIRVQLGRHAVQQIRAATMPSW